MPVPRNAPGAGAAIPWITLGLALAWNVWYVSRYGANIPRADEWRDVSVLLGDQPLTASWLWAPHSVHRIPLPRLVRYSLYRLSGRDFRSALVFNVAVMALAAALLVRTAAHLRGGPSARDAFFPLLLLGPGHYMTFLWAFQVQFALSAALFFAAVAIVVGNPGAPTPRARGLLALTLALQVLTGANGLALALPLMVWLAVGLGRHRGRRSSSWWAAVGLCFTAALAIALYPVGLPPAGSLPPPRLAILTLLQFMSTGLAAGESLWLPRALILLTLTVLAHLPLVRALRYSPSERWRASGLIACFAAVLLVAVCVAIGRAELTIGAGLHARYTTLAIGFAGLVYLAFALYPGGRTARTVPTLLVVLTVLTTLYETLPARGYGEFRLAQLVALKKDADRGLPTHVIAARNGPAIFSYSQGTPVYLGRLLAHRSWPFEHYALDERVRPQVTARQTLPLAPLATLDLSREGRTFRPTGPRPQILLRLPAAQEVAGIELRYSLGGPEGQLMRLEIHWDDAGPHDPIFPPGSRLSASPVYASARTQVLTTWVYGPVDSLRVDLDRSASQFEIHEMTLLTLAPDWLPDVPAPLPPLD
jgi:hypothetical protein